MDTVKLDPNSQEVRERYRELVTLACLRGGSVAAVQAPLSKMDPDLVEAVAARAINHVALTLDVLHEAREELLQAVPRTRSEVA
jgi:hypothetical protein